MSVRLSLLVDTSAISAPFNFYSDVSTRFDNSWLSLLQPLPFPMRQMSINLVKLLVAGHPMILPDGGTTVDVRHVYSDDSMTIALVCILLDLNTKCNCCVVMP